MSEIIKLQNLIRMTPNNWRAVNDISFAIQEKESVLVCGGIGSGKDVLMRLIAGMDKPSSGAVIVLNQAVHAMNRDEAADFRNQNIGMIQQESGFMEKLSVAENITLPLIVRGIGRSQRKKEADELLKILGILHVAQAYPAQLSNYETRIASLARALITKPHILMLNEIAVRLSERDTAKIVETINVVSQNGDYTMLWFSDSVNDTLGTDRTIQIENGKIREDKK